ncbi:uncharacterized protein LOC131617964 [Vicia villosa]|uniref:uncharacterized protein LOC131617964 n=1 Tax=Vicia villosa TaxID=3911 RepID=UPI00273C25B8|nr:uncharacterized protein LOC131617964 [Vicia villosa]
MGLEPNTEDDTLSLNSSLPLTSAPSPPSPPISTSTPLYINPQIAPVNPSYTTPNNVGWPTNHPNHVLNHVGMNSIPHRSSSFNQTNFVTKSDLSLDPNPNLSETHLNRNPFFRVDSDTNQNENKIQSILQLGLEKTHESNRVNSIVHPLSSSAHWFHNRISSGSNRVEKNETNRSESSDLTLNKNMLEPVTKKILVLDQPLSKKELKEPDEPVEKKQNQLDLIRKGKSTVSVRSPLKGSGEINNVASEGEGEKRRSVEKEEQEEVEVERSDEEEEPIAEILKSWNLRPRKPTTKLDSKVNFGSFGGGRSRMGVASVRVSKPRCAKSRARPSLERPVVKEKRRFKSTLTKEETEHDFMLMTGEKPPKKPLRRPKNVQKSLDVLFPGMCLTNVTPEKYMVNDNPPPLKF